MTFKKNWLSILIWIPFALVVCSVFGMTLFHNLIDLPFVTNQYIQIGLTVFAFLLAIGCVACIRKISVRAKLKNSLIGEALLFAILLGIGVFVRCYFLFNTSEVVAFLEEASYFDTAKVNGNAITQIAHGAQYFYVILLRGLFWLFGNHFLAGVILQITLQCLAGICWYIVLRKLSGPLAGLIFMAGVMFLPKSIVSGLTYSPKYMYLLLAGIVLMFLANVLRDEYRNKAIRWYTCFVRLLLGASIGFLIYLDVSGLLFVLPVFAIVFVSKYPETVMSLKQKVFRVVIQILTISLGCLLAITAFWAIDAWQCGSTLKKVKDVWITLYSYKGLGDVPEIFIHKQSTWAYIMILFLLVLGMLAFFFRKRSENQLLWMFLLLAGFGIHFGGFYASGMSCDELLLFLILALTGVGLQALLQRDFAPVHTMSGNYNENAEKESEVMYQEFEGQSQMNLAVESTVNTELVEETKVDTVKINTEVTSNEAVSQVAQEQEEKPKFIENPLPLPKKHVKKTMDYGIEIPPEMMEFDIETSDMDDFDVL